MQLGARLLSLPTSSAQNTLQARLPRGQMPFLSISDLFVLVLFKASWSNMAITWYCNRSPTPSMGGINHSETVGLRHWVPNITVRLGCMKIRSAFADELTAKRVAGTAYLWQARFPWRSLVILTFEDVRRRSKMFEGHWCVRKKSQRCDQMWFETWVPPQLVTTVLCVRRFPFR